MVELARAGALAVILLAAGAAGAGAQDAVLIRVPSGVDAERVLPASRPLFGADVVAHERARAERSGTPLRPVARWVTVPVPTRARAEEIADAFAGRAGYAAEPAPRVAPPPAACRDLGDAPGLPTALGNSQPVPDLTVLQDARGLLAIPSAPDARGDGVTVADVELEWDDGHVDLPAGLPNDPDPPNTRVPAGDLSDVRHGTAVLGVIAARDDGVGVTGLAPEAALRPVSPYSNGAYAPAVALGALLAGPGAVGPGDVVLIELQAYAFGGTSVTGPVELSLAVRDAIAQLVAAGAAVVEPAGNGDLAAGGSGWDLADLGVTQGSGALLVGAGDLGGAPARRANGAPLGNHGARVDVQGLGEGVVSTGGGSLVDASGSTRDYTHCFDGTSSASATVAAAVASLQSASIALTGRPRTPAEVRALLVATGAPQPAGSAATTPIGPRPQIATARAELVPPAPPVIAGGPPDGAVVEDPPAYAITAEPGATISWVLSGPAGLSGSGGAPSLASIDAADGSNDGAYTLTATATDALGTSSAPAVRTFALDNPDPPPPTPSDPLAQASSGDANQGPAGRTTAPPPAPGAGPPAAGASPSSATMAGVAPVAGVGRVTANALVERPAVRSVRARWSRRSGRLVLRLGGLAPRARLRLGGKMLRVRKGVATTVRSRPGAAVLLVRAPSTPSTRTRTTRHRIVLTPGGAVRVRPIKTRGRVVRPAARRVRVVLDRDRGEVAFTLSGLARGAKVRLGGARLVLSGRVARAAWTGATRAVLDVTAPPARRVGYARVRYRVTLPEQGPSVLRRA